MKKSTTSPTARTLAELRKRGHHAQVVERWNQYAKKKFDLFGVIDVVAIDVTAIVGIQTTTGAHHADRVAKVLEEPRALAWIRAGGRIEVWSWTKRGEAGSRKLWALRVERITEVMFSAVQDATVCAQRDVLVGDAAGQHPQGSTPHNEAYRSAAR